MKKYQADLRIPTKQMYAYIEIHAEGTPEEIVAAYDEFTALVNRKNVVPKTDVPTENGLAEASMEKDQKEYIRLTRLLDTGTQAQKRMAAAKLKNVYGEDFDGDDVTGNGSEKESNHSSVRK